MAQPQTSIPVNISFREDEIKAIAWASTELGLKRSALIRLAVNKFVSELRETGHVQVTLTSRSAPEGSRASIFAEKFNEDQ